MLVSESGSTMRINRSNSSCSGDVTDTTAKVIETAEVLEIMILIFLMTFLLVFLAVFGAWRRRSRFLFWKVMLWISYTTSTALITYILGLIRELPCKDELFIIWGMLLLIVYTFPDSFSAYSPEDVTQWRLYYIQFLTKLWALGILWVRGRVRGSKMYLNLDFWVMNLFTFIVSFKAVKRSVALIFASPHSIEARAKKSEVYMTFEHKMFNESHCDPVTMKGYHYFVAVAGSKRLTLDNVLPVTPSDPSDLRKLLERNDVITLQKVWNCQGSLLTQSEDRAKMLKDICLSYSLLNIFYMKIANYALPVEAHSKAQKLILEGLLPEYENDRAFRVIEAELKLLYELIYTKYPLFASPIGAGFRVLEFVLSLTVCGLTAYCISKYADSIDSIKVVQVLGFDLVVWMTYVLLAMIVFAEIAQVWMIFSSEWAKVALIVNYVANKYCLNNIFAEKIIMMVCRPWIWKPWSRVLGQYSLIESRGYGTKKLISTIAYAIYPDMSWDWQKESKAVHLSEEVKNAVLEHLRNNLENGRCSLRHNHLYEMLMSARKGKPLAEDILICHIATSYCQHKSLVRWNSDRNGRIMNYLSKYLVYLVAFAPRLLPGPHFEPQFHFRRVMKEARKVFEVCKKVEDKIDKLDELAMKEDQTIIVRGARLGKQLLQNQHEDIWKILAEFWSEMTLCAATSGEVKAHLEKLANGGEFITHLWTLLYHTGYSPEHPAVLM